MNLASFANIQKKIDRRGLYHKGVLKDTLGVEFQEDIIIWHIATEVFLTKSERAKAVNAAPDVHAIRVMSDYMMFLLVERPYMLPGQSQKKLYERTCEKLIAMGSADPRYPSRKRVVKDLFRLHDAPHSSISRVTEREELINKLYHEYKNREINPLAPRLTHMARLAKELLEKEKDGTTDSLDLVLDVWMGILVYASNKCTRESHAQKLNSGGELTTVLWIMAEYISIAQRDDLPFDCRLLVLAARSTDFGPVYCQPTAEDRVQRGDEQLVSMAAGPLELWNHQSMQILVLLSFGLQLVLFFFAGVRRREALLPRLLLWLAYIMADSTAVYAVGHMAFRSVVRPVREHQLVAFWAPFLLLHLGGPDNITAYAFQDNQLWLRHLQILVVQVLGAAYVLYKHIAFAGGGQDGKLLRIASYLMFIVGVVKYGERTWALKCSTLESIGASMETQPPAFHNHFHPQDKATDGEFHLRRAHKMFHLSKFTIVDSGSVVEEGSMNRHGLDVSIGKLLHGVELWTLIEIQLSLIYDVLYTKAAVVHTFSGYLVRVVSPLTVTTSLLLFQFTSKDGHSTTDVAITYVLLGGAVLMETTSLLNALASSWTFAFLSVTRWRWLRYTTLCNERWDRFRRAVMWLHRLVKRGAGGDSWYKSRRWSNSIGQYNLLHFCTRPADAPLTSPLLGRLARALGLNKWWNRKHYSGTAEITDPIRRHISVYMSRLYSKGKFNTGMLRKKWGQDPLERRGLYHGGVLKDSLGVEFLEGIIIWHIATEIFLTKSERAKSVEAAPDVHTIRVMSDYMMFLVLECPYMLPGMPQKRLYHRALERLVTMRSADPRYPSRARVIKDLFRMRDAPNSSISRVAEREELANNLYDEYEDREFSHLAPRLTHMARLAKELLEKEKDGTTDSLGLVLDVWMDILVYGSTKCSREFHVQKLNSGGELITIVWLMAEYIYHASLVQTDDVV
ncbi:hypothetical protein VPH35_018254 [Triticum aestivum]